MSGQLFQSVKVDLMKEFNNFSLKFLKHGNGNSNFVLFMIACNYLNKIIYWCLNLKKRGFYKSSLYDNASLLIKSAELFNRFLREKTKNLDYFCSSECHVKFQNCQHTRRKPSERFWNPPMNRKENNCDGLTDFNALMSTYGKVRS